MCVVDLKHICCVGGGYTTKQQKVTIRSEDPLVYMGVSSNGGTPKTPILVGKPMVFGYDQNPHMSLRSLRLECHALKFHRFISIDFWTTYSER